MYTININDTNRDDLKGFLTFYLWMLKNTDPTRIPRVVKIIEQVKESKSGSVCEFDDKDFMRVYTAAQCTVNLLHGRIGQTYIEEMKAKKGDQPWIAEYCEELTHAAMYFVNECNSKLAEQPTFAWLKDNVEREVVKMVGPAK